MLELQMRRNRQTEVQNATVEAAAAQGISAAQLTGILEGTHAAHNEHQRAHLEAWQSMFEASTAHAAAQQQAATTAHLEGIAQAARQQDAATQVQQDVDNMFVDMSGSMGDQQLTQNIQNITNVHHNFQQLVDARTNLQQFIDQSQTLQLQNTNNVQALTQLFHQQMQQMNAPTINNNTMMQFMHQHQEQIANYLTQNVSQHNQQFNQTINNQTRLLQQILHLHQAARRAPRVPRRQSTQFYSIADNAPDDDGGNPPDTGGAGSSGIAALTDRATARRTIFDTARTTVQRRPRT